jgi:hypothetical protein
MPTFHPAEVEALRRMQPQGDPTMQLPAIHLNGNTKQSLLDEVLDCRHAIDVAINVLCERGPNSRNYYVLADGPAAYDRAREEHIARIEKLRGLAREFDELVDGIDRGGAFAV